MQELKPLSSVELKPGAVVPSTGAEAHRRAGAETLVQHRPSEDSEAVPAPKLPGAT